MNEVNDQYRDQSVLLQDLIARGRHALDARNVDEAVAATDVMRRDFPLEFRACFDIAQALFRQRALEPAEVVFGDLVERFPNDLWTAHYYARLAGLRRDWPTALQRWALVKKRFPDHPAGYEGEGLTLRDAGHLDRAEAALSAAVAKFPTDFGARYAHADVAGRRWDWKTAVARWQALAEYFPTTAAAHVGLVRALLFSGRNDEAEKMALDTAARFPDDFYASYHYAWLAARRENWQEALSRWDRVRSKFPNNELVAFEFAQSALAFGRVDLAAQELATAATRFPDHAPLQKLHTILPSLRPLPATGDMLARNEVKPARAVERRAVTCGAYLAHREGEGTSTLFGSKEELGGNDYIEVEDATIYNLPGCYGLIELRDGRMYSVGQWGTFDNSIDTIVRMWGQRYYKVENHPFLSKHPQQQLAGRYCMAYRLSSQLYFDFLTETVESVRESLSTWPGVRVLLPGCDGFYTRMPRAVFSDAVTRVAAGRDSQILWLDEGVFQVERLILRRKWWYGSFGFVHQILNSLSEQESQSPNVIYVSRTRASTRVIVQEREIVEAIDEAFGTCHVVHLEDLPFAEQVGIFRYAKVIVGAHGGGLANIVFCRPGTQVIEIRPRNSPAMYAHISYLLALDYKAYIVPKPVHHMKEFVVNVGEFRDFIATFAGVR
jgi:tetratricopeptide (TPR) repeat protein